MKAFSTKPMNGLVYKFFFFKMVLDFTWWGEEESSKEREKRREGERKEEGKMKIHRHDINKRIT